jgi:hypothetical protein
MDGDQAAVRRLRAEGRSYREIAAQLGIPLTRAYKLAQAPAEPAAESEAPVFGCAVVCSDDPEPAPPVPPQEPPPPAPAAPPPGGLPGYLTGPFTMPTPAARARPYMLPGPGGTVIVVTPGDR